VSPEEMKSSGENREPERQKYERTRSPGYGQGRDDLAKICPEISRVHIIFSPAARVGKMRLTEKRNVVEAAKSDPLRLWEYSNPRLVGCRLNTNVHVIDAPLGTIQRSSR
jgi:hypothetical protein